MNVMAGLRSGADNEDDIFEFFQNAKGHGDLYEVERTHADADADIVWRLKAPQGKALTGQLKSHNPSGDTVGVVFRTTNVYKA
ncbi:hypothetical protein CHLRE_21g752097v5 [Chlamydomonas reinhardtii]|uniref:Uncharacterized protein n=1 Tax=Chlamydomonas reinhardtii TaxID=3055 RepID=A0A2K3CN95_CHLRE|nr:uncharacterized protein CHLRE_21g752097v5 [Chlamydomonas reinhardtii]PNW69749.1 hypothetical protein CHLRE_21g752097v5 [Chlamydomonas reinhardtii]